MTTLQDMLAKRRRRDGSDPRPAGTVRWSEKNGPTLPIRVVISTYERPDHLCRLLADISHYRGNYKLSIVVYDDASKADYTAAKALIREMGGEYIRADKNHGKKGFWRWVDRIYGDQKAREDATFVLLPDDVRLCRDFFDRAVRIWRGIKDPKKVALNLLHDTGRANAACWTEIKPLDVGCALQVGWVDGAILCGRRYFDALDWKVERVDPKRWQTDASLSSGVGQQLSHRLVAKGASLYGVKESLLVHVGIESTMNQAARRQNPLRAVSFADGEHVHNALVRGESVTISLASVPRRAKMLRSVIANLYNQCDTINVYLNGYTKVPSFLERPKIVIARSQKHKDRGDAGKFFWSENMQGYHFTVDDDIAYPPDYVRTLIGRIELYGRKAVVGVHGAVLPPTIGESYYNGRHLYHCLRSVRNDVAVHVLGTGTVAYHTSTIKISPALFKRPNMADIWMAIAARAQKKPMICVAHSQGWLVDMGDPEPRKSINGSQDLHDGIQAATLRSAGTWSPPMTAGRVARGVRPGSRRTVATGLRRTTHSGGARRTEEVKSSVRIATGPYGSGVRKVR